MGGAGGREGAEAGDARSVTRPPLARSVRRGDSDSKLRWWGSGEDMGMAIETAMADVEELGGGVGGSFGNKDAEEMCEERKDNKRG